MYSTTILILKQKYHIIYLVSRQDAELRLIDIMKRSMQQKAKCDREYAIGLANVAQQGLKIDRTDELQGKYFRLSDILSQIKLYWLYNVSYFLKKVELIFVFCVNRSKSFLVV